MIKFNVLEEKERQRKQDRRVRVRLQSQGKKVEFRLKFRGFEVPEVVQQGKLERKPFGEKGLVERIMERLRKK